MDHAAKHSHPLTTCLAVRSMGAVARSAADAHSLQVALRTACQVDLQSTDRPLFNEVNPLVRSRPAASSWRCCDVGKAVIVNKHCKVLLVIVVLLIAACTGAEEEATGDTVLSPLEKQPVWTESPVASADAANSRANADTQARIAQLRAEIGITQERQAALQQRRTDLLQQIENHQTNGATLLATSKSARLNLQAKQAAGAVGSSTVDFDETARIRLEEALVEDQRLVTELTNVDIEINVVNARRQALMQEIERLAGSVDVSI